MIVISDTTAISNLFQIGLSDLLKELYGEIKIAPGVHRELSRIKGQAQFLIQNSDWITVQYPKDQDLISVLLEELDLGEAESIALAVELDADYLIIDERHGRRIATDYGIKITGILGVLIKAKKEGLIVDVSSQIVKLEEIGFWLNKTLVTRVLTSLGEL